MQVHNTNRIGSYCTIGQLTPMTRQWSEGKTIFPVRVPEPRLIDKDPATMTLDELEATQNTELPAISYEAWTLTGQGVWSTDRPTPNGTTIADRLPDDHPLRTTWQTTKPISEMTAEELRALDQWHAEHTRGTRMTPYRMIHPAKQRQIQWERDSARSSAVVSKVLTRHHNGQPLIRIHGKRTANDAEYEAEAKQYLRYLRDHEWGFVPTIEQIEERGTQLRTERTEREENNVGLNRTWFEEVYLNGDHHIDPFNYDTFDEEYHGSYEYLEATDLDIDEEFVRSHGIDPEELAENAPRKLQIKIRSERDRERIARNPAHNDALWHARIGQANDIGLDFREGVRKGRIVYQGPVTFGTALKNLVTNVTEAIAEASTMALDTLED